MKWYFKLILFLIGIILMYLSSVFNNVIWNIFVILYFVNYFLFIFGIFNYLNRLRGSKKWQSTNQTRIKQNMK